MCETWEKKKEEESIPDALDRRWNETELNESEKERRKRAVDYIGRKKGRERRERVNVVAVCLRGHEAITKLQKLTIKLGRHGARYHKTSRTTGQSAHIFGVYDQSRGRWERRGCPFPPQKALHRANIPRAGKKIARSISATPIETTL